MLNKGPSQGPVGFAVGLLLFFIFCTSQNTFNSTECSLIRENALHIVYSGSNPLILFTNYGCIHSKNCETGLAYQSIEMSVQLVVGIYTHGYLAQLVERLTVNQIVKGSIPLISVTLTVV